MSKLSENIHRLSKEGKNYREIKEELGCSKGTISYHLGVGQKEKAHIKGLIFRNTRPVDKKIYQFCGKSKIYRDVTSKIKMSYIARLDIKILSFCRNVNSKMTKKLFSTSDLLKKIGNNPKCYLTGRSIDLNKPQTYELDHIIPMSKGGSSLLENCNIACKDANRAKSNMFYDDFIKMCEDIVQNKQNNTTSNS